MIFVKVAALIVFLCAVYFGREVVHEAFDPARQPVEVRSSQLSESFLPKSLLAMDGLAGGFGEPVAHR